MYHMLKYIFQNISMLKNKKNLFSVTGNDEQKLKTQTWRTSNWEERLQKRLITSKQENQADWEEWHLGQVLPVYEKRLNT